jgi:glycosyltransferase involved in cell wall biosynthesis
MNFEFIIIDNASTDNSSQVIKNYATKDNRIVFLQNKENECVGHAINRGINIARGEYIARMDDDDISLPKRFEKQIDFLDENKDITVIGTFIEIFGDCKNNLKPWITESESKFVGLSLLFGDQICNSSSMTRKSFIDKNKIRYKKHIYAEDYEFWKDIILKGGKVANIPEVLAKYRWHGKNISVDNEKQLIHNKIVINIQKDLWRTCLSEKEITNIVETFFDSSYTLKSDMYNSFVNTLLHKVAEKNTKLFPASVVNEYISKFNKIYHINTLKKFLAKLCSCSYTQKHKIYYIMFFKISVKRCKL